MRNGRSILVLVMIGVAIIGARQLLQRIPVIKGTQKTSADRQRNVLKVVSTVPRIQSGKYGLSDVALLPNGELWAVGYDEKTVDHIYRSNDKGGTWNRVEVPAGGFLLAAITFADAQHGWAVGNNGVILRTIDGGTRWQLLKTFPGAESGKRPTDLHAVHFVDANVGYIAGGRRIASKTSDELTGDLEILCTKDGGDNWRSCYQLSEPLTVMQITNNAESTFVVLNSGVIMRSDDRGESWWDVSPSTKNIRWLAFGADGSGWAVGSRGVFQKTTDAGRTWTTVSLPAELADHDWWGIAFNSNGVGLAVGEKNALAITTDNGKTWQLQTPISSDNLRAIRMRDSQAVVLGARNAYSLTVGIN